MIPLPSPLGASPHLQDRNPITTTADMPFTGYGQSDSECDECIPTKRCALHEDRPVYPGHRNDGPVDLSMFGTPTGRGTFYFGRQRDFPKIKPLPNQVGEGQQTVQLPVQSTPEQGTVPRTTSPQSASNSQQSTTPKRSRSVSDLSQRSSFSSFAHHRSNTIKESVQNMSKPVRAPETVTANEKKVMEHSKCSYEVIKKKLTPAQREYAVLHANLTASGFRLPPLNLEHEDFQSPIKTEFEYKTSAESKLPKKWAASTHGFGEELENRLRGLGLDGTTEGDGTSLDVVIAEESSTSSTSTLVSGS